MFGGGKVTRFCLLALGLVSAGILSSCGNGVSFAQRESPANQFKDYRPENRNNSDVLGIGEPMSAKQARANATFTMKGEYDLEAVMNKVAGTYNVAVRWGNGVRKNSRHDVLINSLAFDEMRSYVEDNFNVQIIREGARRLLVLPSASEPRLTSFSPGDNVTLGAALKGLAQQCSYNLVINENKEKLSTTHVSTHLKNVTCFDAFEALLNPQGLSLVSQGDYYTIGGLPQREWTLNLYEPERTEELTVNYSSSFSGGAGGSSSSGGISSGSSGSSSGSTSNTSGGSNNVSIKYDRNLWTELEGDLNQLLASSCEGMGGTAGASSPAATPAAPSSAPGATPSLLPPPVVNGANGSSTGGATPAAVPTPPSPVGFHQSNPAASAAAPSCGYVRINRAVGLVQMRGPLNALNQADQIIQRVADIASRRLLLEARVVAVTRDRSYDQDGKLRFGRRGNGATTSIGSGSSITSAISNELASITSSAAGASTNLYGISVQKLNLDAVMGMLESYGTTYELMHPIMELMDRQRATLIDGRNEKYFIIQSTSTTGTATTTSASVDERDQFVGLQFSASAQISDDPNEPHTISLQIPITSIVKTVDIPNPNYDGTNGSPISGQAPVASTRLIDQKVRIRDGEIKVIGGLTRTLATDNESGLPIIRQISGLGKLFNTEGITYEQVEFVVLLQVKRLS
jgi:type II secretory pathway component GspD/PulD (secretin)